jgi:hypothetical protein
MTGTAHKIKQKLKEVTSPSPPLQPTDSNNSNSNNKSSLSNLLHHKSNSTSTGQSGQLAGGVPIQAIESGDSIASDPSNYLTDQQLEQDLVLEEMTEREHEIGHQGRSGSTVSAPPSIPVPAPEKPSGGMYGGNLFGHGGGGGGKKKGSKQKFAERQVCPLEESLSSGKLIDRQGKRRHC